MFERDPHLMNKNSQNYENQLLLFGNLLLYYLISKMPVKQEQN